MSKQTVDGNVASILTVGPSAFHLSTHSWLLSFVTFWALWRLGGFICHKFVAMPDVFTAPREFNSSLILGPEF